MATRTLRIAPLPLLAALALLALPGGAVLAEEAQWRPVGTGKAKAAEKAKEAEARAKADADAKAKADAEAKARADADAEAEAKARSEAEAKARAEAEEKARAEEETKARAEADERARADAKAKADAKADEKARAEAEARAKAEEQARAKAEAKAKAEAEARAKEEEKARARAEAKAKAEADAKAKAEEKARAEAEQKAKAEERARAEAEARASEGPKPPPGAKKITPPVYTPVVVHLKDGGAYRGTLEYELKGYELVIKTVTGVERRFPMADVERVEKLPLPAAPVVVHLKDGGAYKGNLILESPGVDVLIRTAKGADRRFPWDEIDRVERLDAPAAATTPAPTSPAPQPPPPPPPAAPGKKGAKGGAKAEPKAKEPLPLASPPPSAPSPTPFAGADVAWPSMGRAREAKPLPKTSPMTAELVPLPPPPGFGSAPVGQAERVEATVKPKATAAAAPPAEEPPPAAASPLAPAYEPPPLGAAEAGPAAAGEPSPPKGEWSFDADKTGLAIGYEETLDSDKVRQSWAEKGGTLAGTEASAGMSFIAKSYPDGSVLSGVGVQGGGRLLIYSLKAPDYETRGTSWTAWKVGGGADFSALGISMSSGGYSMSGTMTSTTLVGNIGFLHATGSFDSETEWSGFAVGLDWSPTYQSTTSTFSGTVMGYSFTSTTTNKSSNMKGFTINFESGSMKSMAETMAKQAHYKLSIFILPPVGDMPLFMSVNIGAVWY